jgi:hypothetical protein
MFSNVNFRKINRFNLIVFAMVSAAILRLFTDPFPAEPNFIGSCCCFLFFPISQRTSQLALVIVNAVGLNHLTRL